MNTFRNADLIARLRRAGDCYAPVLMRHDVAHIQVVKADILHLLQAQDPNAVCAWMISRDDGRDFYLDVAA